MHADKHGLKPIDANPLTCANKIRICFLLILGLAGCQFGERDTKVQMSGGELPSFVLTGSGRLSMLRIHGPAVRLGAGEDAHIQWEIQPIDGNLEGEFVERIGTIVYGTVPKGYKQIIPESGPPPRILPELDYDAFFVTTGANHATVYFSQNNGKLAWKIDDFKERSLK
jgi:hypothetical protein